MHAPIATSNVCIRRRRIPVAAAQPAETPVLRPIRTGRCVVHTNACGQELAPDENPVIHSLLFLWMLTAAAGPAPCTAAPACSCALRSVEEQFAHSDAVFAGRVLHVGAYVPAPSSGRETAAAAGNPAQPVTLRVTRAWKGAAAGDSLVVRNVLPCGVHFEVGQLYVVYAERDEAGALATTFCQRSGPLRSAGAGVAVLDSIVRAARP